MVTPSTAQMSLCAVVKIEISQDQVLERQAFEARLGVSNGLEPTAIENLSVALTVRDADGELVAVTSDPYGSGALFFDSMDAA